MKERTSDVRRDGDVADSERGGQRERTLERRDEIVERRGAIVDFDWIYTG